MSRSGPSPATRLTHGGAARELHTKVAVAGLAGDDIHDSDDHVLSGTGDDSRRTWRHKRPPPERP